MISKYGNSAVVQIATVSESVYHVACQGSSETGLFVHISSHVFRSAYFRKEISHEGHLFFENISNLLQISKI